MSLKEFAVQGATLKINGAVGGNASISTAPSSKVDVKGKGVYKGTISVTVNGTSSGSCFQTPAPATGTIMPTATKCTVENENPIRKGDVSQVITVAGMAGMTSCSYTITVELDDPGQSEVKGS